MMSCSAYDGVHGKISGGIKCNTLTIADEALDYAFGTWGKRQEEPNGNSILFNKRIRNTKEKNEDCLDNLDYSSINSDTR